MNKQLLLCFLVCFTTITQGQTYLAQQHLGKLFNAQTWNPATLGESAWQFSLLNLSSQVYSNKVSLQDFIGRNGTQKSVVYPSEALNFGQGNYLRTHTALETFRLTYQKNKAAFSLHHASKTSAFVDYSGALLALAIRGNSPFVGQSVPFNTDGQLLAYEEIGLGITLKVGEKWTFGLRPKWLSGHSALHTRRSQVDLFTSDDVYQLSLETDLEIDVAGAGNRSVSDFNFGPLDLDFSDSEDAIIPSTNFIANVENDLFNFSGNNGWALDLGVAYAVNDRLQLTVNVLDIGQINWQSDSETYTAQETFAFDGLNLGLLTFDEDEDVQFSNFSDSLDVVQFDRQNSSFSTSLPAQFYAGLDYQLGEKWQLTGRVFYLRYEQGDFSGASVAADYQVLPALRLGTSYTVMNETAFLLGLHAVWEIGSLQLYATTSNVLGAFDLASARTVDLAVGVAVGLGE
ncbi:MAG: DUF5723 family protein [Bacteroidota bacterium]